jgi:hypothetical protein
MTSQHAKERIMEINLFMVFFSIFFPYILGLLDHIHYRTSHVLSPIAHRQLLSGFSAGSLMYSISNSMLLAATYSFDFCPKNSHFHWQSKGRVDRFLQVPLK